MKHLRLPIVYSIVLYSGQWLNKPREKAEKGREKLGGKRVTGSVVQNEREEKALLEKAMCAENDKINK